MRQVIHDAFFQNESQMTKGNTFRYTRPLYILQKQSEEFKRTAISLAIKSLSLHLELLVTIGDE